MKCFWKIIFHSSIVFSLLIVSCEGTQDKGVVSFASNTAIVNCPLEAHLFINNSPFGVIPPTGDSISDCYSSTNLHLKLPVGKYRFNVEFISPSGGCNADTSGTFEISKDICTQIFIDVQKLHK
jgi:hypothetical protein